MPSRQYYSARKGRTRDALLDLDLLRRLFVAVYKTFASKHYLDEAFGTHCTDAGYTPGTAGEDIEMFVLEGSVNNKCIQSALRNTSKTTSSTG
jgi:hypothetical protein